MSPTIKAKYPFATQRDLMIDIRELGKMYKTNDIVLIKTGKKGRPPKGEILGIIHNTDGSVEYRVKTKTGPEIYKASELTLVNPA